jgi:5-oxoprolinase (ATP-hydrolysing)
MAAPRWQFWIDVGGTFTDCIAQRPDGSLARCKVLSSGVTKSVGDLGLDHRVIVAAARDEPDGFWDGYRLRLLHDVGEYGEEEMVGRWCHESKTFTLVEPLAHRPRATQRFELDSGEPAPIVAIRQLLGLRLEERIPPVVVRLGTTRGTNAMLTRTGARTAFVTSAGFGDILKIGYQNRPRLFDLAIKKAVPLFERSIEIDERVSATGEVLVAPREDSIRAALLQLREAGIESLAVCLLHGYRFTLPKSAFRTKSLR